MWGKEVAWEGVTPAGYDGTYSYTVKYNNKGGVVNTTINSYYNPVIGSFKRDGLVDVDGDDVQGSGGELGGKFLPFFIARDNAFGCGFGDNITYDKSPVGWGVALCFDGPADIVEEIDKDWDIHAAFTDMDQFFKSLWHDQTTSPFALDIAAVRINGINHYVPQFAIQVVHNNLRPRNITIYNGAGLQAAVREILTWDDWVQERRARAVPGVVVFARAASARGVTVFYLSNRAEHLAQATLDNLRGVGMPVADEGVFLALGTFVEGCEQLGSEKLCRRRKVGQEYRVLMQFGDQLGDFVQIVANTPEDRAALLERYGSWFGERWWMLPNPSYGSWEPAVFNNEWSSPREVRRAAKRDALELAETGAQ